MIRPSLLPLRDNPPWGLFDKKDQVWLGDESGPFRYAPPTQPFELVACAALVFNKRFGFRTRIEVRHFTAGRASVRDEVTPRYSAAEALGMLGVRE